MRGQEPRIKALDLSILLQPAVVLDRLVEDVDGLALAPPHDLAPADEQRLVCHLAPSLARLRPSYAPHGAASAPCGPWTPRWSAIKPSRRVLASRPLGQRGGPATARPGVPAAAATPRT